MGKISILRKTKHPASVIFLCRRVAAVAGDSFTYINLPVDSIRANVGEPINGKVMAAKVSLRLKQEVIDTYRLAQIGGYFYLAGWLVVAIYGDAFSHSPVPAWSLTLLFLSLAVARRLHRPPPETTDIDVLESWLKTHWLIVFCTTTLFGSVFLWTLLDARLSAGLTAVLLSTMGLAVAIAHAFAMRFGYALVSVAVMYLPGLAILWRRPEDSASAIVMTIYLVYVVATLWRSHDEYQHRLDIDQQLRDQSDLFEQQGRVDALTELANRRFFSESLMSMSQSARNTKNNLILIVLDLDYFKNINDQHGHTVGDSCLSIFASRLKENFSSDSEHPARLGGEEFGVLLQGESLESAIRRAEEFCSICAGTPIQVGTLAVKITVSIGVAKFDPDNHRDGDGLYRAADSAVYRAKNSGRNRVCSDEREVA